MAATVWFFLRSSSGELRYLPRSEMHAFVQQGGRIAPDEDGLVRYAQVVVNLEDRRVVELLSVAFIQRRAHPDGTIDREHFLGVARLMTDATFGDLHVGSTHGGVVRAEHRFAKRRLEHTSQWKPTDADFGALRSLVNRRARREVM